MLVYFVDKSEMGKPQNEGTRGLLITSPVFHYLMVIYTGTIKKSRKISFYLGFLEEFIGM